MGCLRRSATTLLLIFKIPSKAPGVIHQQALSSLHTNINSNQGEFNDHSDF
ncbi:hypothetical protein SAMN04515695_0333 [Pseudovibrio sp. Tun.PSC04-5.I4]|nr:hypothetical protein SAMN04515695_0333 [Pseudovibrio sp. Tun.PSC04-5.I4]